MKNSLSSYPISNSQQGSPLSAQQTRLWAWQKEGPAYRTLCAVQIQGIVQRERLKTAISHIVERHEILHTIFYTLPGMDVPVQVIGNNTLWSWSEISLEYLDGSHQSQKIDELFIALQREVCDLQHGPLLQIWLFRLAAKRHVLVVNLPALCADSSSLKIFIDELRRAYAQEKLTEEVLQYADVSAWQENVLLKEKAEIERQYWYNTALSQMTAMPLPFQRERCTLERERDNGAFAPQVVKIPLQDDLAQRIEAQAQRYGVPISSWFLACWQVLLWRLSDEPTFLIGVACNGRNYEELENALGLYTRFIPFSASFEKDRPFEQVLASVNISLQEATKRQIYFTWNSVGDPKGENTTTSFFPVSFECDLWPATFDAEELTFSLVKCWSCIDPFKLKLGILQVGRGLQFEIHYDPQFVASEQVQHLISLLQTLVQSAAAHPSMAIGGLPILEPAEQTRLLAMGDGPRVPVPALGLHRLFEAQARRVPNSLAVISAGEQLTYQQLNERANQLAHVLRKQGVGPNTLVGLRMKREVQMLVGLLGILKAGGAYLPLDPGNPPVRLASQLQQSQALLLLSQQGTHPHLPEWEERTLWLEDLEQEMAKSPVDDLPSGSQGEDLAYVIFTSGSTGAPKGVMIQHESVVNYTLALCQLLKAEPGWHYATVSTLAADLGNTAIFCALASGGCVQVLDYETVTSTQEMAQWVEQHPIDVLKIVPSHLSALLTGKQAKNYMPQKALVLGGEVLPVSLLKQLEELGASCQIYNHYGPTETTIGVLINPLGMLSFPKGEKEQWKSIPVGRPINNAQVYILDQRLQPVPMGIPGELFIGGAGLARGYTDLSEQTAERFVPHPWSSQPGARLYRTGDLACYRENGQIELVGRQDRQIKLRGYRIELAEIEATLQRHPQVRDTIVVLREDVSAEPQLVSYVVARQQMSLSFEQLREFLRQSVPEYMVPAFFVQIEALPLTANGKIDWQELPAPEQKSPKEQATVAGPRSPIEEMFLEIWRDLLSLPELGIHDNFFQMGGHSLLATQVMAQMQSILQVVLPVQLLFEAPTVAALAQRVEQTLCLDEGMQVPPLMAIEHPEAIPLSFAQQRLWFLEQLEPGNTAYLSARARRLLGNLNTRALEQSMEEIIRRHESLRTTFEERNGQVVQIIHPASRYTLPTIDLQGLEPERREGEIQLLAGQEAQFPCDLVKGPLLRTYLLRSGMKEHIFLLTLHHIITDGWSNEILLRDLSTLYRANVSRLPSPLAPLAIQYADYALWQRRWLQDEVLEAQLVYWRKQLANVPVLEFPTDHSRFPARTYQGAIQSRQLPGELSEELVALSQREGVTLFMLLLAAFQTLLLRYTGQTDICVGTPIANRTRAGIEGVIGFFVNTLVLRTDLSGNPTFLEVLSRVREVCLGAYAHQDVPFEKLVEALQPERDLSRSPFFQVSFELSYAIIHSQLLPGLSLEPLRNDGASADHDLRILMTKTQQGFSCTVFYNTNLFEASTIDCFLGHFQILLQGIVAVPETAIALLPLLSKQEQHKLLIEWNSTQRDYPQDLCTHQLFERQAEQTPDAVALVFADETLTYAELNRRANQLAHYLQGIGVGPEVLVGICMQHSLEMVIGLLGVLKAGGAYLPLDPDYPKERLTFLMTDAHVPVLLTQQQLAPALSALPAKLISFESVWGQLLCQLDHNIDSTLCSLNLSYTIYTSGSTGAPKGVMIAHQGLVNYLSWCTKEYQVAEGQGTLVHSSLGFDLTITSLFSPLLVGQRVVLLPESQNMEVLAHALRERNDFSLVKVTPSHLEALNQLVSPQEMAGQTRVLVIGGEALLAEKLSSWRKHAPTTRLINEYGPTETVVGCCAYEMATDDEDAGVVAIGTPTANMNIFVLDGHLQPVPVGVSGELYISGDSLARGYRNRPDLTAERFLPDPWSQERGGRLYRTGDLAHYLPDGNIEFLGRLDQQVKIRGYRIEPGEIEAILRNHPAVRETAVTVREARPGDPHLVAYVGLDLLHTEATSQEMQADLVPERLKHWQQLYDEMYQQRASLDNTDSNFVGWNSSYTGQPLATSEMQAWLEDTLALVQAYSPKRILEIGCGTGLLLLRLAPACASYYGTDFSAAVLAGLHQQLANLKQDREGKAEITLLQRQADDFRDLPQGQFDTVLLNSVIQYFPDVHYLLRVLKGALQLVAPGGRIIVGDVRSLPLLEAFHASVQLARAPASLTRQQLWQQVQQHIKQEKELVLDPTFFGYWAQTTGQINRVEVRLKRGRHHNELTLFRYQVVLHVGEPMSVRTAGSEVKELNWIEQAMTRKRLCEEVMKNRPKLLRLRQVPNARVCQAVQTVQWLKSQQGPETVGQWRAELSVQADEGVEPEDLWEAVEPLGYQVTISWGQHGADGGYTALLQRKDGEPWVDPEEETIPQKEQRERIIDWQRYVNQPLQAEGERLLVPQIRHYLRERLPDYLVPAHLVVLKTFPLTPNGKVDRRALPAPEEIQSKENKAQEAPKTPIEELVRGLWSEVLGCARVGSDDHFFESGGHSLLATQLVARMRAMLGVEIPVKVVFESPRVGDLARRVEHALRKSEGTEVPPLVALPHSEEIPASFAQQRLWFLDQLHPESTTYLSSGALRFQSVLNTEALEHSLQELVRRHEVLRTTFAVREGQPMQVIHPTSYLMVPVIDLQELLSEHREEQARYIEEQEKKHPCDLGKGPLLRASLLRLGVQEHVVFLTLHHIITDGWSNGILVRELTTLYQAFMSGQSSPLTPLPIQYADYALWQRQWLQGEILQKHIAYWLHQLEGASALELPTDVPRTAVQSDRGARYSFALPAELSAQLASFSRQESVTLFMTLLTAFQVLLYRLTGQTDIVVGTDVANRTHVETEKLIGFFVNLLALRTSVQRSSSFRYLLQYVRAMVLDAYAHQELPFELIVEHLQLERPGRQTPLVQVLFVLQNAPRSPLGLPGLELEILSGESTASKNLSENSEFGPVGEPLQDGFWIRSKFDLALFLQEEPDGIRGSVVYRAELFREQTIVAWMRRFEALLSSMVGKPDSSVDDLEILADEEKIERASAQKKLYRTGNTIWQRKKSKTLDLLNSQSLSIREDND